jgi:hypothetical protein
MGVGSIMPNPQKVYLDDNGELAGSNSNNGEVNNNKIYLHPDTGEHLNDNIKEVTDEPSDFTGGFLNSVFGGEALKTGLKGGLGFLKGSILDIPETLMNTVKGIYDHPFKSAVHTLLPGPLGDMVTGDDSMSSLRDASSNAGSNPEAFGRIMGQLTGQPLVMEGGINLAPRIPKIIAPAVEGTGRIMKNYTPISNTAGVAVGGAYGGIPGAIAGTYRPFTKPLRAIERFAGQGIENIGKRMRGSSLVSEPELIFNESGYNPNADLSLNDALDFGPSDIQVDMPNISGYRPTSSLPNSHEPLDMRSNIITNEDLSHIGNEGNSISTYKAIRGPEAESLSNVAKEFLSKKKVRLNKDGTYTDLSTGEVLDSKGNSVIEINDKPVNRDSFFFSKNRSTPYESKRLPKLDPQTMQPKNYGKILLESPNGTRLTVDDIINKTGTKYTPEQILDEMATGQGLQKYGYKIIG